MTTFDLRSERWILVTYLDGKSDTLGLRETLCQAHRLRAIRDPLPTVEFGLYRMLVALVMDIFAPRHTEDLAALLGAGTFAPQRVDNYLEQWQDRFDLFDSRFPFLQTAGMEELDAKPVSGLLPPIPSGTGVLHFHHRTEDDFAVGAAAAARLLCTIAPFMTAGGAGLAPSINGAPPWYVLVDGGTVFRTLCLNCCVVPLMPAPAGDAPPAWRNDAPPKSDGRSKQASLLEGLTWRPRRVQLIASGPGRCSLSGEESRLTVREMHFAAGASCDFTWCDPNVPYQLGKEGMLARRPQEGREVWRDIGPLALLRQADYESEKGKVRFERPAVVTQFAALSDERALPRESRIALTLYGMRTDMKMKVFEWQRETLALPPGLIRQGAHGGDAQRAIERADTVAYYLRQAIKHAYPRGGAGNKKAFDGLVTHAQRGYWNSLRAEFDELLVALANLPDDEDSFDEAVTTLREGWGRSVTRVGKDALEDAIGDLDTDGDALRRQVEARRAFVRRLGAFPPRGGSGAEEREKAVGAR